MAVLVLGHYENILNLSLPIYFSSNNPQWPKYSGLISETVDSMRPPVANMTLFISSWSTLPAANTLWSAKKAVAKSPIGNLDNTTLAPESMISYNFLYIIFHSASTMD